jgi:hypothetical protein
MQTHSPIRTRREMIGFFEDRMHAGMQRYDAEGKQTFEEGAAKSYLLESDLALGDGDRHDGVLNFLRESLRKLGCEVEALNDEGFFSVTRRGTGNDDARRDQYFVQADDPRFWLVHTLAKSEQADRLQQDMLRLPKVDSAWFPKGFLLDIARARDNDFQGFSSRYDNSPFAGRDEELRAAFSLKLWGNLARDVLTVITDSPLLERHIAISGVRVRHRFIGEEPVLDDVTCYGKVTAFGASFNSHYDLVATQLLPAYRRTIVGRIEGTLAFGLGEHNRITGAPIIVQYTSLPLPLEDFVRRLFSGAGPFRLWGIPQMVDETFARVHAVDMHVGHKLTFDITPHVIRIELPRGSCGNTIARFFTLFQQHYDASATIRGGDFADIFRLEGGG